MKHHYNKEELIELKRKYDMQVSKEAIEEIKHTIDLDREIERLKEELRISKMSDKDTYETSQEIMAEQSKEIERLKRELNKYRYTPKAHFKETMELRKENERLNNIINELEKEFKEDYKIWMCNSKGNGKSVKFGIDVCKMHFYNRLQELKGSDKE